MIKKAFVMQVNPDAHEEYHLRHRMIWPELVNVLKQHGAHSYSIFLDEKRHLLFGYVEVASVALWDEIAQTEICQKWWAYMADIMVTHADNRPVSHELKSVFYLD